MEIATIAHPNAKNAVQGTQGSVDSVSIETWTSDKGNEEIHHFADGQYLWGFNRKVLGEALYHEIDNMITIRLRLIRIYA